MWGCFSAQVLDLQSEAFYNGEDRGESEEDRGQSEVRCNLQFNTNKKN